MSHKLFDYLFFEVEPSGLQVLLPGHHIELNILQTLTRACDDYSFNPAVYETIFKRVIDGYDGLP